MQTAIISLLIFAVCIILICMAGCVDDPASLPGPEESAEHANLSSEEKGSSYILTRDGIPLRYAIQGQGSPIFFVLGYGMTIDEWPHQLLSQLAQTHTVIVYNHRGVSGVKSPGVPFTIPQAAMDLHDVITELAGGNEGCGTSDDGTLSDKPLTLDKVNCTAIPVDIVGYSMGGMVALEYAKTCPESVNHLVLISTDCGGAERVPAEEWVTEEMGRNLSSPDEFLDRAGRLLLTESFRAAHPDPRTWFVDYGEVADPAVVQEQYESFLSWNGVYPDLPLIHSKTLVITGDQDIVIPSENAVIIADAIPNATLIVREGQGHGMIFAEPEQIAGIIREFLEERRA